jgi:hypothetical protein
MESRDRNPILEVSPGSCHASYEQHGAQSKGNELLTMDPRKSTFQRNIKLHPV